MYSPNRPNTADDDERVAGLKSFFIEELQRLSLWLSGLPLDETRLAAWMARSNRIIHKTRQILRLRLRNPLYIRSLATTFLLGGRESYYGRPDQYEAVLDALIEELEASLAAPIPHDKVVRLAWAGWADAARSSASTGPSMSQVAPSPVGTAGDWTRDYREDLPPLDAYADYIITARTFGSPVRTRKRIDEYLPEFGAKENLFHGYIGCSFASVHREIQAEHFRRLGYPGIFLEGSFQIGPPTGQALTRVRAFLKMLSR